MPFVELALHFTFAINGLLMLSKAYRYRHFEWKYEFRECLENLSVNKTTSFFNLDIMITIVSDLLLFSLCLWLMGVWFNNKVLCIVKPVLCGH